MPFSISLQYIIWYSPQNLPYPPHWSNIYLSHFLSALLLNISLSIYLLQYIICDTVVFVSNCVLTKKYSHTVPPKTLPYPPHSPTFHLHNPRILPNCLFPISNAFKDITANTSTSIHNLWYSCVCIYKMCIDKKYSHPVDPKTPPYPPHLSNLYLTLAHSSEPSQLYYSYQPF